MVWPWVKAPLLAWLAKRSGVQLQTPNLVWTSATRNLVGEIAGMEIYVNQNCWEMPKGDHSRAAAHCLSVPPQHPHPGSHPSTLGWRARHLTAVHATRAAVAQAISMLRGRCTASDMGGGPAPHPGWGAAPVAGLFTSRLLAFAATGAYTTTLILTASWSG